MANAQSRRNLLTKERVNGAILIEDDEIKDRVHRAYHFLLSKMGYWRPSIKGLCFEVLRSDCSKSLEEPFSEEEVFNAFSQSY